MSEPTLSERMYDFHVRRVDRWSHADQCTVGQAIWALRKLEALADVWNKYLDPQQDGQWSDVQGSLDALAGGYEIVEDDIEVGPGLAEALTQAEALAQEDEDAHCDT